MIAVDTNILARFYCDDPHDKQSKLQRPLARRTLLESPSIFVPLTVVLELEWVMRGFYEFEPESFCQSMEHLLGMPHATVERWEAVDDALHLHRQGLDFADALHLSCSSHCAKLVTFDDRGFVRRARKLKTGTEAVLPGNLFN